MHEIPQEYICPKGSVVMLDPVMIADGHSYERRVIQQWFDGHDTSPSTNAPLEHKTMIPNVQLKDTIHRFVQDNQEALKLDLLEALKRNSFDRINLLLPLPIDYDLDEILFSLLDIKGSASPKALDLLFSHPSYKGLKERHFVIKSSHDSFIPDSHAEFASVITKLKPQWERLVKSLALVEAILSEEKIQIYHMRESDENDHFYGGRKMLPFHRSNLSLLVAQIHSTIATTHMCLKNATRAIERKSVLRSLSALTVAIPPDLPCAILIDSKEVPSGYIRGESNGGRDDKFNSSWARTTEDPEVTREKIKVLREVILSILTEATRRSSLAHFTLQIQKNQVVTTRCHRWAAHNRYLDVLKVFLAQLPAEYHVDSNGNSLVHWAARGNAIDVLKWLIDEQGFQPDLKNKEGKTPQMIAHYFRCDEAEAYLARVASRPVDAPVPVDATTQTPDAFFHHSDGAAPAKDNLDSAAAKLAS